MSWAHFADIGGLRPGSISPDATDVFQEGIIVPPTKMIDRGVPNEAALAIFHRNSRFPDQSLGDMRALMASVELGARRVGEILDRFGPPVVADALAQLLERTRSMVRSRLAETFDYGTHAFTDAIDSDGHGNGPFKMRFSLTRRREGDEDRYIFDATASDDQAPGPVNYIMNDGVPGMALGLFYLGGDPAQVCNAGGPNALDEVLLPPGLVPAAGLSRAAGDARADGDADDLGDQRPPQRRRAARRRPRTRPTSSTSCAAASATRDGKLEPFLLADGIGVGYGARATS